MQSTYWALMLQNGISGNNIHSFSLLHVSLVYSLSVIILSVRFNDVTMVLNPKKVYACNAVGRVKVLNGYRLNKLQITN